MRILIEVSGGVVQQVLVDNSSIAPKAHSFRDDSVIVYLYDLDNVEAGGPEEPVRYPHKDVTITEFNKRFGWHCTRHHNCGGGQHDSSCPRSTYET